MESQSDNGALAIVADEEPEASEATGVEQEPHSVRTRFMFALAAKHEVANLLRTQAESSWKTRLPAVLVRWEQVRPSVAQLEFGDSALANQVTVEQLPSEFDEIAQRYTTDHRFSTAFGAIPSGIGIVEIDKLVAGQRIVYLEYAESLKARFAGRTSLDRLLEICTAPDGTADPIPHLEVAQNTHAFSSPSTDLRFLGAFIKDELTPEDLELAQGGGVPAGAIIAFVGYGSPQVNCFLFNGRCILNNGFHRLFALRELGVTHAPVVVQHVSNPMLEMPPLVAGLPRDYLLGAVRPAFVKDFFNSELCIDVDLKSRLRSVTLGINLTQMDVPT
jgi:hypothetical protein